MHTVSNVTAHLASATLWDPLTFSTNMLRNGRVSDTFEKCYHLNSNKKHMLLRYTILLMQLFIHAYATSLVFIVQPVCQRVTTMSMQIPFINDFFGLFLLNVSNIKKKNVASVHKLLSVGYWFDYNHSISTNQTKYVLTSQKNNYLR